MKKNYKILILDDERSILDLIENFLNRKELYNFEVTTDPYYVLEEVKNNNVNLIITDIMMPEMNGIDVLKFAKKINNNIKVIMITAFYTIDKIEECERLDADDYITKPFSSLLKFEEKIIKCMENSNV